MSVRRKSLSRSAKLLAPFAALFALAIAPSGAASAQAVTPRPCDLLASTTPCVAAISTTRALYAGYTGPLYQVMRVSDKAQTDIGLLPDGYANAAQQNAFCRRRYCIITKLYDQSPNHNDLTLAPPGGAAKGPGPEGYQIAAVADALPVVVGGHEVYGVDIEHGMGYRDDTAKDTAVNGEPEGVYMVTSALHLNHRCCFDFGNAETNNLDNDHGHMDAINIKCRGRFKDPIEAEKPCAPDAGLDMENGIPGHFPVPPGTTFATVMGGNDGQHTFAIYQGNAAPGEGQSGALTSTGTIPLPAVYQPMHQEGAIILGIGGDNSNWATGYFFEGVMTKGEPDAKTMQAVQDNIVAAHYAGQLN